MALSRLVVDIHTHVYLPRYASVLRSRTAAPRILSRTTPAGLAEDRLVILDDEPSGGRPVGPQVRALPVPAPAPAADKTPTPHHFRNISPAVALQTR